MLTVIIYQSEDKITRKPICLEDMDIDQRQHTKQCNDIQGTLQNSPQTKVQRRRRPRKQPRPYKLTSGTLPHKWDKTDDQPPTLILSCGSNKQMESIVSSETKDNSEVVAKKYEVKTTPINIAFQIMQPDYIQWQPKNSSVILKAPCYCRRTSSTRDKYVTIRGIHISTLSRAHFYFQPALNFQNLLVAERIHFNNGIKLIWTKEARQHPFFISKGNYLGELHLVFPILTRIY